MHREISLGEKALGGKYTGSGVVKKSLTSVNCGLRMSG